MAVRLSASSTGCVLFPRNILVSVSGTHYCLRLSKPHDECGCVPSAVRSFQMFSSACNVSKITRKNHLRFAPRSACICLIGTWDYYRIEATCNLKSQTASQRRALDFSRHLWFRVLVCCFRWGTNCILLRPSLSLSVCLAVTGVGLGRNSEYIVLFCSQLLYKSSCSSSFPPNRKRNLMVLKVRCF
jgi:hypothetical protein